MTTLNARLQQLRQQLGVREDVIAAIVLAVLGAGGLSFTVITHVGTPAGAALAYMAAIDRGDVDYVWSHTVVDSASTSPATLSLLDRPALAAQVNSTKHTRSSFSVQSVGYGSSGTQVTLAYDTSAGRRSTNLVMRGGAPHSWPVLAEPAGLDIALPPGAGALAVDGRTVEATANGELIAAVFPGDHQVSLQASSLYLSYVGEVHARVTLPSTTRVDLSGVKLSDVAVSDAKQAVSAAFKNCAGAGTLKPAGCPQALTDDLASDTPRWSVLGDPLSDASIGLNDKAQLQVTGHYLMKLAYDSAAAHGTRVLAIGGPYAASLKWDGQAMSVAGFAASPATTVIARPGTTDAQILTALKSQFDSCLAIQAGSSEGCPQRVVAFYASNFVWHANGDPLQGAAVTWDSTQGFYKATGNFDFSVDYDSTPPYSATRHYQDHSSGQYIADLYWDGSKVVFISFEK